MGASVRGGIEWLNHPCARTDPLHGRSHLPSSSLFDTEPITHMRRSHSGFFGWLLLAFLLAAPPLPTQAAASPSTQQDTAGWVERFDCIDPAPGRDEADSVPMGNGNTGINLWVEEGGDLRFYLARNDALSEMHRLVKLGRVRISISPNPFARGEPYQQALRLRRGICEITAGAPGRQTRIQVLVDAGAQIVRLRGDSDHPVTVTATLENWRQHTNDLRLQKSLDSTWIYRNGLPEAQPSWESPDAVSVSESSIAWVHQNRHTPAPIHVREQRLEAWSQLIQDPIRDRVFGGRITGSGMRVESGGLKSRLPVRRFDISVATGSEILPGTGAAERFQKHLERDQSGAGGFERASARTAAWWETFWKRSWLILEPGGAGKDVASAEALAQLNRAYVLVRYQLACQERSPLPAHFNGGIFTVAPEFAYYANDPRGKNWSADYRFYGPSYWWQNTRFLYQLHLAQGNFDLTDSFFEFYFRNQPVFAAKAKSYYGASGIYMNETLSLFGLPGMGDFGWGAADYSEPYTRQIWQQCLEFGAFALDRFDYTGDRAFLKRTIDWCDQALRFYDTRFRKDAAGKIWIEPSHGLETYWTGVANDMPSIAGLHEITRRLLALPESASTPEQRAGWRRIQSALPDLPKRVEASGKMVPDNAARYDPKRSNYESPDLNSVYPFRVYGLGRSAHDIEEARRAWRAMPNPGHTCWYQTGVVAARLGLTEGAAQDVLLRSGPKTRLAVTEGKGRLFRFPGFFASPHDWCPDYDGAGNMANTLQEMLVQPGENGKILLLPAWPSGWDVEFKLHAPGNTLLRGRYRGGRLEHLEVEPKSRRADVVVMGP